ncbi:type II toxin-antitoxin system VapB family antitoxin [Nocardia aurantiaca]|uniref:Type II toxin-antitoxin system VapB family antitoxin n=1 Tax=Nocardia aurantiaca TaxID=2675850 RepID=A0A6I3KTZ6_9NOCA|nr:type II toxin-antitoxin system VapB family antitoxin [Nocardia aurantiaca]MTE12030.1 type II toxin-antitoxin system VapB family antitoxin [Nocardia aurantiaca]
MSRTLIDIDDDALALAAEELGTKTKVATVNAALREIANRRAVTKVLQQLRDSGTDLSPDAMGGAWR